MHAMPKMHACMSLCVYMYKALILATADAHSNRLSYWITWFVCQHRNPFPALRL